MKYELDNVVRVLSTHLHPAQLLQKEHPERYLRAMAEKIIGCARELQMTITLDSLFFLKDNAARAASDMDMPALINRLNYLQRDTTRALNILYKYFRTRYADDFDKMEAPVKDHYYAIFNELRNLLLGAWKYYRNFWNHDLLVPHFYRAHRWRETKRGVRQITQLLEQHEAPYSLISTLTVLPMQVYIPSIRLTFKRQREILGYVLKGKHAFHSLRYIKRSLMANFFLLPIHTRNLLEAYAHTASHFAEKLETVQQHLTFYHHEVRNVSEALLLHRDIHDEHWVPILADIHTWLAGRIQYLEKAGPLAVPAPAAHDDSSGKPPPKIRINATSHELALFLRFAVNTGLIEDANFNELVRLLAPYVKSSVGDLQPDSLRTQSYTNSEWVLEKLAGKLAEIQKEVVRKKREGGKG
ncbi:hypothetical protein [Ferruginibacter sp. HRS2-29]|uniref:hypothetical protein n=1 Tax=Ferruginibacter sp. HRS2-29 TaxID=2487334 RepID=UPI0020CF006E|nr:hypothetical protein [Ferruginibacter sp. HRS2-29]MCP9751792.1 hypothetical protein [Ferruginibacter sp. HRS2-29]